MRTHIDYETRCDLDIKKVGLWRYVTHPSFRVLLTAWAEEDGEVQQAEGFYLPPPMLSVDTYNAFNAPFEMAVVRSQGRPVNPAQWRCTMAHAYARGFAKRLKDVGEQVGLPEDRQKLTEGGRLINWFCTPPYKPLEGDKWERFKLYNRRDVTAERGIWHKLNEWAPWTPEEQRLWELDRLINERGLPVDLDLATYALVIADADRECMNARCKEITGLSLDQTGALLKWAQDNGYNGDNLQAETIQQWLNNSIPF
jgi:DNA polymerase